MEITKNIFEKFLKKYSLYFPSTTLPTLSIDESSMGYKGSITIFNLVLEESHSNKTREDAIEKITIQANRFLNEMIKSVCIKIKEEEKVKPVMEKIEHQKLKGSSNITKNMKKTEFIRKNNIKRKIEEYAKRDADIHVPRYKEDKEQTNSNILNNGITFEKDYQTLITEYCRRNKSSFPEYLFEKSNGVYICRATYEGDIFESRYAFDVNIAKEDVCKLIYQRIADSEVDMKRLDGLKNQPYIQIKEIHNENSKAHLLDKEVNGRDSTEVDDLFNHVKTPVNKSNGSKRRYETNENRNHNTYKRKKSDNTYLSDKYCDFDFEREKNIKDLLVQHSKNIKNKDWLSETYFNPSVESNDLEKLLKRFKNVR